MNAHRWNGFDPVLADETLILGFIDFIVGVESIEAIVLFFVGVKPCGVIR